MKILISEKISPHRYKTSEGYLVCTDAILARTGKQTYLSDEIFHDGNEQEVEVDRPYKEVFDEKTLASFENKPITIEHPDESVNVGNYKDYAVGYVRDIHQGKTDNGEDVILGNLVIVDQNAINDIESGTKTDLSCGYDCDIVKTKDGYSQVAIRGNHLALCEEGRAGIAHIQDSQKNINDTKMTNDAFNNGRLKDFKIEDLIRLVKKRSEAVNSIRLGDDGNTYYITVGGFLNMDLNTGKGAYLDVVYENKDSTLQKRCLMIPKASSWKEIITAFNNWKNTLRSINDSKIRDDFSRQIKSAISRGKLITHPYSGRYAMRVKKSDFEGLKKELEKLHYKDIIFENNPYVSYNVFFRDSANDAWTKRVDDSKMKDDFATNMAHIRENLETAIYKIISKHNSKVAEAHRSKEFDKNSLYLLTGIYDITYMVLFFEKTERPYFDSKADIEKVKAEIRAIPNVRIKSMGPIESRPIATDDGGQLHFYYFDKMSIRYTGKVADSQKNKPMKDSLTKDKALQLVAKVKDYQTKH